MDVLLHPPKGARAFPLETDPQFVKPGAEKIFLHGSVFVKITPIKLADMRLKIPENAVDPHQLLLEKRAQMRSNRRAVPVANSGAPSGTGALPGVASVASSLGSASSGAPHPSAAGVAAAASAVGAAAPLSVSVSVPGLEDDVENYYLPYLWRLQIYRATKMTAMHPIDKNSTICEVCWKGAARKGEERIFSDGFLTVGETSVRSHTVDPDWRGDPSAVYELPPVWTDHPSLADRYTATATATGSQGRGGWIAKNHLDELEKAEGRQGSGQGQGSGGGGGGGGTVKESDKIAQILSMTTAGGGEGAGGREGQEEGQEQRQGEEGMVPRKMTGKLRFKLAVNKVLTATKLGRHSIVDLEVTPSLSLSPSLSPSLCLSLSPSLTVSVVDRNVWRRSWRCICCCTKRRS
jgi:hypothetical protein